MSTAKFDFAHDKLRELQNLRAGLEANGATTEGVNFPYSPTQRLVRCNAEIAKLTAALEAAGVDPATSF